MTIRDLMCQGFGNWLWFYCRNPECRHDRPVALAPFAIRYGLDCSFDLIRERAKCEVCGSVGVQTILPSWVDSVTKVQPFPSAR